MKNLISLEEFINEDSINEKVFIKKTPEQAFREASIKLDDQIAKYSEMMRTKPEKANYFKALLDVAHAKMTVLTLKRRADSLKESEEFDQDIEDFLSSI
jgi:hypothetical protein